MSKDRHFPVVGRPYIVKLKGVWQEQIYVADREDGTMERFWYREDLDEYPIFDYEHDDWISIREAVSNRDALAALKGGNERFKARVPELVEALTELCAEIDKHEIHTAISNTSISWFKRKAHTTLDAYRKGDTP